MAKKLIVGNWKMAPETAKEAETKIAAMKDALRLVKNAQVIICPPTPFLEHLAHTFKSKGATRIMFGTQNIAHEKIGAFTGEVSPGMLKDVGAEWVIVGHSERRALGESDALVMQKVTVALKAGLSVILCVGEKERDEHGHYFKAIEEQLLANIPQLSKALLERLVLAYEPLWAIGEKAHHPATPEEVFSTVIFMRKIMAEKFGKEFAMRVPVLYGGSVTTENAASLLQHGGVEGLLVGRESLQPKSFITIVQAAGSGK